MTRSELEHLIRAAGAIAEDSEIVVIGSQSILGQFPDAPRALLKSAEADVYPRHYPERADLIDGSIGEGSSFHETFGYYAQGVGEETATLPKGWQSRVVRISNANTAGTTGLCLEVHDLAISKYAAGREKDLDFTRELARHGMTNERVLLERLAETVLAKPLRNLVAGRINADSAVRKSGR
ncbi:MAG TPA: DUF6036 family nucleotidyltransferase [Tepidiformaceae bacterium]|nr:DUF6036 family nucleotidyltransferase [Tepidiformaceae bacterium]